MSVNRHFEIIYLLLERKKVTAKELAEHFEVSTRTIYRDVDVLSGAGIPIYASKGKGGGISLLEGYALDSALLTSAEQTDILTGLQTLAAMNFPDSEKILDKAARLFKRQARNWLDIDFAPWGSGTEKKSLFHLLRDAITQQLELRFSYVSSKGEKTDRCVEPYQLIFKQNAWYLLGFCIGKQDFRVFKVSRILRASVTQNKFALQPVPDGIGNAEQAASETSIPVMLQIASRGAFRVYDEFDERVIQKNEDGTFLIQVHLPDGPWLVSYLLSFGSLIEKIGPEDLSLKIVGELDRFRDKLTSQA